MKLYMLLLGCKPKARNTEQHDVFFGIANSLPELIPQINAFWPEVQGNIHIDVWREVTAVENFHIAVVVKTNLIRAANLFFINLGGYRKNEFEEHHYKILTVASNPDDASKAAKNDSFYKHHGFAGAPAHIDDKYGIDVDEIYDVTDILADSLKSAYELQITASEKSLPIDILHIGYLPLAKLK